MGYRNIKKQKKLFFFFKLRILIFQCPGTTHITNFTRMPQQEQDGEMNRFLEMHMYVTSPLEKTDMKAVAMQMAFDLVYEKEHRDVVTGLKSRTQAGRPNWNKVFTKLEKEDKGKVTVFYCGNQAAGKIIKDHCTKFNFKFKKEVF